MLYLISKNTLNSDNIDLDIHQIQLLMVVFGLIVLVTFTGNVVLSYILHIVYSFIK